jgi:hypothetical protein
MLQGGAGRCKRLAISHGRFDSYIRYIKQNYEKDAMMKNTMVKDSNINDTIKDDTKLSDTLTANDRCDYCGSQAYFWVNGINGDLLFCRHDFLKWEDKLRSYAFEIVDESHKLGIKVQSSP